MDKPIRRGAAMAELEQARSALAHERQRSARLQEALREIAQTSERCRNLGCDASGPGLTPVQAYDAFNEILSACVAALAGGEGTGESEGLKIRLTRRGDDWHACPEGEPALWACGTTRTEALGQLVRIHRERFGVGEISVDDYRETPRETSL